MEQISIKTNNRSAKLVNRPFVLLFENIADRTVHVKYYLPTVEMKDYNVMINGQNVFDQSVKSNLRTYDSIRKIATGQEYNFYD